MMDEQTQTLERVAAVRERLQALETKVEERENVQRVWLALRSAKLASAALKTAPDSYYSWTLAQRAQFLGCSVPHLCKSIIVENTAFANVGSRYYCVVLQYNSKLNTEQLQRFVRELIPADQRPGRKAFNFQHAPGHVSEELTGFGHNGVSPFGMQTSIPVVISGEVVALEPSFVWLGGGAESVKLRISVQDLAKSLGALVAEKNLTTLRTDL